MNQAAELDRTRAGCRFQGGDLEITMFQIADDALLMQNRDDGTGWDWCWADWQRDWMDATPSRFAYRCLPLTIANQTGFWIKNPVGFTATWRGPKRPEASTFSLMHRLTSG